MKKITFNKIATIFIVLTTIFLYIEFQYKKSLYFEEKIYDLELQYQDKLKTFQTYSDFWSIKFNDPDNLANGINLEEIIGLMDKNLDASYTMILKRDCLSKVSDDLSIRTDYHQSCLHGDYMMRNTIHDNSRFDMNVFKPFEKQIQKRIRQERSFALYRLDSLTRSTVIVFAAINDLHGHHVGYLISKRQEGYINRIYFEQFLKFLSVLFALYAVWIYYRKHVRSITLLDQYKAVVDQTTLLSKTDTKGRITYVNEAFETLSGYTAEELIGKPHNIVRHPDVDPSVFKTLWATIKSGKMWHGQIKNRKKDGSAYVVDASIFPIMDEKGSIIEYIAIRHDITELEELKELLQKDLQDSNQSLEEKMSLIAQYEKAIEQAASYTRTDLEGVITYLNKTHEHLTGYTKEELIGTTHKVMRDPATPASFYKELWECIQQKRIWKGVIKNRNKDGNFIFLDTIIVPIMNKEGEIREYMSIQYDVTELLVLQEEIVETQREVIYKMGEIAEQRSKETGNHVKRVAAYSRLLAIKIGMSEEEADLLYAASPMHDIGKVGIPDSILNKPGKLDDHEWEVMRAHADIGYNILKGSDRPILKAAAIVAQQHHEKWDGSGYPRLLEGENIHIYGRITAIADVFDALGSDRVYKKGWRLEEILELFRKESGKHFDPELIEVFFEHLPEFLEIRDSLSD